MENILNGDIYWSHACLSSLKSRNYNMFNYALFMINDEMRKNKLEDICQKVKNNHTETIKLLNKFESRVPVVVA